MNSSPATAAAHAAATSASSSARAARSGRRPRRAGSGTAGWPPACASANIGTLAVARVVTSASAPSAMPTATLAIASDENTSSGMRPSGPSSPPCSKMLNVRSSGTNLPSRVKSWLPVPHRPGHRPRVDDLDVGRREHHHPQRRHAAVVDHAVGDEPVGVLASAGERPAPGDPEPTVDRRRHPRRVERPGAARHRDRRRRPRRRWLRGSMPEDHRRRAADHHRPADRPVGTRQLTHHGDVVGEVRLGSAEPPGHQHPEAARRHAAAPTRSGGRRRACSISSPRRDDRRGQRPHGVEDRDGVGAVGSVERVGGIRLQSVVAASVPTRTVRTDRRTAHRANGPIDRLRRLGHSV